MKLGYHDCTVESYETGTNDRGNKLLELCVVTPAGERTWVCLYFASPDNIRISLEQLRGLGWEKGHAKGLDSIIGAPARIEVYEDKWRKNDEEIVTNKARLVSARRKQVKTKMASAAAQQWLESLDAPVEPRHQRRGSDPW